MAIPTLVLSVLLLAAPAMAGPGEALSGRKETSPLILPPSHLASLRLETPTFGSFLQPTRKAVLQPGSATVEVWGETDPKERLRLLRIQLNPELVRSFHAGLSSSVGAQILSDVMAMPYKLGYQPPSVPSVYTNCYMPLMQDPYLVRLQKEMADHVRVSAQAERRR